MKLIEGDCLIEMAKLDANSIDSIVTDPPYGLSAGPTKYLGDEGAKVGFMGKGWDHGVPGVEFWTEALRVLKPGGHLLAFGGTRTVHRLTCAIEDAGFEIRDQICWLYGCLSDDTEILINGQWEPYHKAIEGSLAMCYDVASDSYSWQPVEQLYVYDYADTAYRIRSDHTDQIVSRNHRCLVERGGAYAFEYAEALQRQEGVPVLEDVHSLLDALPVPHTRTSLARVEPFPYVGKVWCVKVPTGAFVVRRNGKVFVTGNSGFPKSLDVSKAIDKAAGAAENRGHGFNVVGQNRGLNQNRELRSDHPDYVPPAPATDAAKKWAGWGTALKPSHEPVIWARKQLTVVPLNDMIECENSIGSLLCLSLSSANHAEAILKSNQNEFAGASVFARWSAAALHGAKFADSSEPMGMFKSPETGKTFLNIAASWQFIWDATSYHPNTFTTSTATALTTALRTCNSLILATIQDCITPDAISQLGLMLSAITAEPNSPNKGRNCGLGTSASGLATLLAEVKRASSAEQSFTLAARVANTVLQSAITHLESNRRVSPAHEPVIVARKPLIGTVAQNVLAHGTGAINIDGCRVETTEVISNHSRSAESAVSKGKFGDSSAQSTHQTAGQSLGRWPANLLHDGSDEVRAGFPQSGGGAYSKSGGRNISGPSRAFGTFDQRVKNAPDNYGDSGSAARFFYCAKASKSDRWINLHCDCQAYIMPAWETRPDQSRNDQTDTTSQRVATSEGESTGECDSSTSLFGSGHTDDCPTAGKSTTSTKTNKTTPSKTLAPSALPLTNEYTPVASSEMESGGSPAPSAKRKSQLIPSIGTCPPKDTRSTAGASPAMWPASWKKSGCEGCGAKLIETSHPTVKPQALMRYLCRLVTPPGGTILDPFAGSGSTGIAARDEGFDSVLIEREAEFCEIIRKRFAANVEKLKTKSLFDDE